LRHLVCDVNGTLATDGILRPGVGERFARLKSLITIHLLTADTHGRQHEIDEQLGLRRCARLTRNEAGQKAEFVRQLGAPSVAAIGQGANDAAYAQNWPLWAFACSPLKAWPWKLCSPQIYDAPTLIQPGTV
jgi:soluble P-type ATPase